VRHYRDARLPLLNAGLLADFETAESFSPAEDQARDSCRSPHRRERYRTDFLPKAERRPDSTARNAHDVVPGGQNFLRSEELDEMLAYPAHVYRLDVMFGKFSVLFGKKIA
jgi:hypothetical protein